MRPSVPAAEAKLIPPATRPQRRQPALAPRLILVDEVDQLRVASIEQLRDLFCRSDVGLVLIGMPGIEE